MQFFQILALVGVASAHAVSNVTSVATATTPVVALPPANATGKLPPPSQPHHGANSTWGSGAQPTGTKPAPVTGGAAGTKASIAGLLGFAGVAMLVL